MTSNGLLQTRSPPSSPSSLFPLLPQLRRVHLPLLPLHVLLSLPSADLLESVGTIKVDPTVVHNLEDLSSLKELSVDVCVEEAAERRHPQSPLVLRPPQSLAKLNFSCWEPDSDTKISLVVPIPSLRTLLISGFVNQVAFDSFLAVQGPFITSLLLFDTAVEKSADMNFDSFYGNPDAWDPPSIQIALQQFRLLLPILASTSLSNLQTLTVLDYHLPFITESRKRTLSTIVVRPNTIERDFFHRPLIAFNRLVQATRKFDAAFPSLKEIRFEEGWSWRRLLVDFDKKNIPMATGELLRTKGLRLFDGDGVEWDEERFWGRKKA